MSTRGSACLFLRPGAQHRPEPDRDGLAEATPAATEGGGARPNFAKTWPEQYAWQCN